MKSFKSRGDKIRYIIKMQHLLSFFCGVSWYTSAIVLSPFWISAVIWSHWIYGPDFWKVAIRFKCQTWNLNFELTLLYMCGLQIIWLSVCLYQRVYWKLNENVFHFVYIAIATNFEIKNSELFFSKFNADFDLVKRQSNFQHKRKWVPI